MKFENYSVRELKVVRRLVPSADCEAADSEVFSEQVDRGGNCRSVNLPVTLSQQGWRLLMKRLCNERNILDLITPIEDVISEQHFD